VNEGFITETSHSCRFRASVERTLISCCEALRAVRLVEIRSLDEVLDNRSS
jgi:hypothetical protein